MYVTHKVRIRTILGLSCTSSDWSFAQQSLDCLWNPRIILLQSTLSSYCIICRQVIHPSRTYTVQCARNFAKSGHTRKSTCSEKVVYQKSIVLAVYRAELGKVQQRHLEWKSIVTLFNNDTLLPTFFPDRKVSFICFLKVSRCAILQPTSTNQRSRTKIECTHAQHW